MAILNAKRRKTNYSHFFFTTMGRAYFLSCACIQISSAWSCVYALRARIYYGWKSLLDGDGSLDLGGVKAGHGEGASKLDDFLAKLSNLFVALASGNKVLH